MKPKSTSLLKKLAEASVLNISVASAARTEKFVNLYFLTNSRTWRAGNPAMLWFVVIRIFFSIEASVDARQAPKYTLRGRSKDSQ